MKRVILSFDGGGIRGIIPALAIQKLEQDLGAATRDLVGFVAGTSTGALLASAIAVGFPATRMVDVYRSRLEQIFKPGKPWNDIRRYTNGYKYNIDNLRVVLKDVLEKGLAVPRTMNDSPIGILLTAKAVSDGKQWYFTKDHASNSGLTGMLSMVECACASAAAPTYFNPVEFVAPPIADKLVDGGTGVAGNPVYEACVEAFEFDNYRPEDTIVISFGTGRFIQKQDPRTITAWLSWTLDVLLNSPEEQQSELVARHYPEATFYRLDPNLPHQIPMDDISKISELDAIGRIFSTRIDWKAMLNGDDTEFRVKKG